ncbi:MAG: DNA polymerase III subunit beta [Thermoleophilia bacterium]|nr:DNA polymerase III subunit beta [Thermoleophilia bacterium]
MDVEDTTETMSGSENTGATGGELSFACEGENRQALLNALTAALRATSSRTSVQVLSGIRISARPGAIELAATDMDLSLRTTVAADVRVEGEVLVPGKLFTDVVRELPPGAAAFTHHDGEGSLAVAAGSYASRINLYAVEDFPRLPATTIPLHRVPAAALRETIDRVSRAASRDESRPVLTGILVRFEGTTLSMAATDSYRLSLKETELAEAGPSLEAIIPARALQELTRLAATADEVGLGVSDNHVVFQVGETWLTTRRIDGTFPDVQKLLPETFRAEVELPRAELLEAVRRAGLLALRNTPLRLRFAEGELTVSAQSQDVGETRETLPVAFTGDALEIGFNADFLRDGLESVTGETVRFRLIEPLRPGLLVSESDRFWYLIMPIRLAG